MDRQDARIRMQSSTMAKQPVLESKLSRPNPAQVKTIVKQRISVSELSGSSSEQSGTAVEKAESDLGTSHSHSLLREKPAKTRGSDLNLSHSAPVQCGWDVTLCQSHVVQSPCTLDQGTMQLIQYD